ncbi:MAG: hypothetical protein Q4D94_08665, partial [Bacillota bacterium]|nr:hypothetical protein [Bacillota bacterium]
MISISESLPGSTAASYRTCLFSIFEILLLNPIMINKQERTESKRIKAIHENVRRIRTLERKGVRYMQRWEELYYAKEDGKIEGKIEG